MDGGVKLKKKPRMDKGARDEGGRAMEGKGCIWLASRRRSITAVLPLTRLGNVCVRVCWRGRMHEKA